VDESLRSRTEGKASGELQPRLGGQSVTGVSDVGNSAESAVKKRDLDKKCGTCKFFSPTAMQDSGLTLPDGSGPWFYQMGQCQTDSSYTPGKGWGRNPRDLPSWTSCHLWKRARGGVAR
jgi:hypothetical protein